MKSVFRYLKPTLPAMLLGLFIKFSGTIIELLLPWMLSVILDDFVPARNMAQIIFWGVLMVLCSGGALAGNVIANRMATRISRDFTRKVRYNLFSRITELSCAQTDAYTTPSLISRLTSDTYNLHQMVDRMQRLGVRAPILLIGGIAVTFVMEPVLTLVLLAVLPLLGVIVVFVSNKGIKLYTTTQSSLDRMIRKAQESIAGIRVIQALSKTDYEKQQFAQANQAVAANDFRATMLMNITNPVMNFLLNGGLTLVVLVGAYRVNAGHTSPGTIVAFLSYFTIMLNALMMVTRLFVMYSKGVASGRRIAEILDAPRDMLVARLPKRQDHAHIRFENVCFSYSKVQETVKNISFSLKKGETLGIIGATGSGKTTLLHLLLRFYDPDSGAVSINGTDLRAIPEELLHTQFGVVFQNDFLYAETISENIDIGRGLPEAARKAAAKTAQADFIQRRQAHFAGEIAAKGADLSGGQKQRLLIARALAASPQILVLDDSSSALDYKTDAALRHALHQEFSATTKIIVAQRVSAIQNANHILVLEEGEEIGYGTHEELMGNCAVYRDIAAFQMQEVE